MSKQNTIAKMVHLIRKMEQNGLWLTYKRVDEISPTRQPLKRHFPTSEVQCCIHQQEYNQPVN